MGAIEDAMADAGDSVRVVLLGRRGCHLCDEARVVVSRVCDDLGVAWREDEISEHPELLRKHTDDVPVTFVDGEIHDFWRVDEGKLRAALSQRLSH